MWNNKSIKSSGIYRTNDNINNFQIQITLKTISSLLKIDKFELIKTPTRRRQKDSTTTNYQQHQDEQSNENDPTNNDEINNNDDHIEIITIKWQQKILSSYEIEFYKDIENCLTDIQKDYHNWIINDKFISSSSMNKSKIFTYIDNDNFIPKEEIMLYNKPLLMKNSINQENLPIKYKYHKKLNNNNIIINSIDMYIYANLNPDTLLCSLKWLENDNILIIYPDFNIFNINPYFIEIDTDYRHLYSYSIKNLSNINKSIKYNIIDNNLLSIDNQKSTLSLLQKQQINLFNMPIKKSIRFLIIFNIQEAENFEYDSLHIRYKFQLPDNIRIETINQNDDDNNNNDNESILLGSTHSSIGTYHNDNDNKKIWHFGHSIQFLLTTTTTGGGNDENFYTTTTTNKKFLIDNIQIFFEIISIDTWERERIEGYSYISIILKPGNENYILKFYRPYMNLIERIERYFIGGRILFDLNNFNNNNISNNNDNFLNRYQHHSITTGLLKFNIQCIVQRNLELLPKNVGGEMKQIKKKSNCMTLDDIMKSYQQARKRLQATVDNETQV